MIVLPIARARAPWWRRLLAWVRWRRLEPRPASPLRFDDINALLRELRLETERRANPLEILGRNLGRVGYHLSRPAPTAMPGPGEKVSR